MKKVLTKAMALFLCVTLLCSFPVSAYAAEAPAWLTAARTADGDVLLNWTAVPDAEYYKVYYSTDGANYDYEISYENSLTDYTYGKGIYYYYVTAVDAYSYEESAPSNVASVAVYYTENRYVYLESTKDNKLKINWSYYADGMADGFYIYRSKNGGAFQWIGGVSVSAAKRWDGNYGDYVFTDNVGKTPARYQYVVATYVTIAGTTYCHPDFKDYEEYIIRMPAPTLTTKTKTEVVKWKKVSGMDYYEIWAERYKLGSGSGYKKYKVAKVAANKTSYTVKNVDNTKYNYVYTLKCYKGGKYISESVSASSSDGEARMRAATKKKKNKNKVTVVNTRGKKNKTAWTVTISKKDKKILDDFAKKNFKKGWSNVQKAEYTLNWINKKVKYAKGKDYNKIAKKSYVDAIFKSKKGQCLQYNGAYAMFLTYLGYEARIIQGWRGRSTKNKWSHYWCEIKVDGKWYLMETGNYDDSGSWSYFCQPYAETSGYIMNNKLLGYK